MTGKFLKVKCKDCESEQIIFEKASTKVSCQVCNTVLVEPTGGRARIKAEVVEELE